MIFKHASNMRECLFVGWSITLSVCLFVHPHIASICVCSTLFRID
jgi:hypothetical protein